MEKNDSPPSFDLDSRGLLCSKLMDLLNIDQLRVQFVFYFNCWYLSLDSRCFGSTVMSFEMSHLICHCCQNIDIIVDQKPLGGRPHFDPIRELASLLSPALRCGSLLMLGLHPGSISTPSPAQHKQRWSYSIPCSSDFINSNFSAAEFT